MAIWFKDYKFEDLATYFQRNMVKFLDVEFTEIGSDFLAARMPVDHRTTTPVGLLHGGASCVLAESIGSCASYLCIDTEKHSVVGIEINANHIKSLSHGHLVGVAKPIHLGRSIHVWDIRIHNEANQQLVCVSRLTTKILDLK